MASSKKPTVASLAADMSTLTEAVAMIAQAVGTAPAEPAPKPKVKAAKKRAELVAREDATSIGNFDPAYVEIDDDWMIEVRADGRTWTDKSSGEQKGGTIHKAGARVHLIPVRNGKPSTPVKYLDADKLAMLAAYHDEIAEAIDTVEQRAKIGQYAAE